MPYDMFIEKLRWLARDVPASPGSRYVLSRAGYDSEAFSSIRGWCHAKPPTFALGDTGEEGDILESFFESFKLGSTLYVDRFVNALFVKAGDVARKHDVLWRNTTIEEIYGRVDKDSRLKRWLINTWVEQRASLDSDHETLGCADDRALLEDFKWDCVRASAKRVVVDSKVGDFCSVRIFVLSWLMLLQRGLTKAAAAKPYFEKPRTIPVRVVLDD